MAGIDVDVCAEHGTWFDRGELQRVAAARLGTKAEPLPSGPPCNRAVDLAADVAMGSIRLFFAILFD